MIVVPSLVVASNVYPRRKNGWVWVVACQVVWMQASRWLLLLFTSLPSYGGVLGVGRGSGLVSVSVGKLYPAVTRRCLDAEEVPGGACQVQKVWTKPMYVEVVYIVSMHLALWLVLFTSKLFMFVVDSTSSTIVVVPALCRIICSSVLWHAIKIVVFRGLFGRYSAGKPQSEYISAN